MSSFTTTACAANGRDVEKIEGPIDPKQLKDVKFEFEFGKIKLSNDMIKRLACELNEIRAQKFYGVILSEDIELAIAYCNKPSLRGDPENE
jgi:hypothetical protein